MQISIRSSKCQQFLILYFLWATTPEYLRTIAAALYVHTFKQFFMTYHSPNKKSLKKIYYLLYEFLKV